MKNTLNNIKNIFDSLMTFAYVPLYCTEIYRRRLYVCRNNGQFHHGDMDDRGDWATFVGKFTRQQGLEYLWAYHYLEWGETK